MPYLQSSTNWGKSTHAQCEKLYWSMIISCILFLIDYQFKIFCKYEYILGSEYWCICFKRYSNCLSYPTGWILGIQIFKVLEKTHTFYVRINKIRILHAKNV